MGARVIVCGALTILALLAMPGPVVAQAQRAGDVSVSYAGLKDSDIEGMFARGWAASVAGALTRPVHIVGELGGNYKTLAESAGVRVGLNLHTFLGGARFVAGRSGRVTGFVQALAGATRISAGITSCGSIPPASCAEAREFNDSRTFFTLQPGGGVDVAISPRVGVRMQGDYRAIFPREAEGDGLLHEFRFAVGVVLGFGTR